MHAALLPHSGLLFVFRRAYNNSPRADRRLNGARSNLFYQWHRRSERVRRGKEGTCDTLGWSAVIDYNTKGGLNEVAVAKPQGDTPGTNKVVQ
jgi:hypothetical protein